MLGRPVFPASDSLPRGSSLAPSFTSTPIQAAPYANYTENLRRAHTRIASLPEVLCPRSRSPSPATRAARKTLTAAVVQAGHNPASTKWGQVSRSVAMASTSRRYCGAGNGVRVGEKKKVDVGSYQWVLPSTEEEWKECEKKWERRLLGGPSAEGRTSKFWSNDPRDATGASRTDLIRDKVKAWQAKVVPARTPETQTTAIVSETETQRSIKGKGKETETKRQSPLNFPVAKRTAVVATPAKGNPTKGLVPPMHPPSNHPPNQELAANAVPSTERDAPRITDLSEMEFLPPSFPTQLKTSTPPVAPGMRPRKKPSPIPVCASSPSSSPQLPNVPFSRPPIASSSLSPVHSARLRPTKRPRISSPPPPPEATASPSNGHVLNVSGPSPNHTARLRLTKRQRSNSPRQEATAGSPNGPVLKKARTSPAAPGPSSSAPPPPSTPPPFTPPVTPTRQTSAGKGLGNARGVPMATIPNRPLPTLTDLLASSRRSKPRPRPPSRKPKTPAPEQRGPHEPPSVLDPVAMDVLPVLAETNEVRDVSPAPTVASRARTLFSSPASGSSGSPQSVRGRPRSPVSPLFSQQGGFVPPLTSTQFAGGPGQGTGLSRGGSGVFGMGYSSQFDVEGQVGMVSEILDRDVDFDGWLRDIPEVETEG